jgi:multicomponent Na+:H+ antiporter subunit D
LPGWLSRSLFLFRALEENRLLVRLSGRVDRFSPPTLNQGKFISAGPGPDDPGRDRGGGDIVDGFLRETRSPDEDPRKSKDFPAGLQMKEHLPILVILLTLAGGWASLLLGFLSYRLSRLAVLILLLCALYGTGTCLPGLLSQGTWHYSLGGWAPPWGIELVLTPFTAFLACLVLLMALMAFLHLGSFGLMAGLLKTRESTGGALLLVGVSALLALLWVRDGFTLYLFLQISLVAAVGLIVCVTRQGWLDGFYFLLGGSLGASLLLTGLLFLFSATGSLHLDDLLAQLFIAKNFTMTLGGGFFIVGSLGYLFFFPLPLFFARFLNLAPPFLLGFLSSVLVRMGVYLLFLFLFFVLAVPGMGQPAWLVVLKYMLVIVFLSGFVLAARQKDFLHSAAYLSFAQLAFPLIGFMAGNKGALTGSLMELFSQMPAVMGLFMAVGIISLKPAGPHPFSKLAGLGRHDFGLALALIIFTFSIAGVPPTGGCFGKYYLLHGLWEKRDWFLLGPLAAILIFNLWSAVRFLWLLFEHRKAESLRAPAAFSAKAPLFLLAALVLLLGIFHQNIIQNFIEPALPKAYQNIPLPNVPFLGHQVE